MAPPAPPSVPSAGRLAWLAAGLLALGMGSVWAGGNTQFRNPSSPSQVFDKLWDTRMLPITWVMSEDGLPGSGISNAALSAELTAAFDTWEALPASRLDFAYGGEVPIRSSGLDGVLGPGIDGVNLVTFTDPEFLFPPGVLAVAITVSFSQSTVITGANSDLDGDGTPDVPEGTYLAGTIFDGDIVFNSSEDWSTSGTAGTIDIRAVALHEVGHSFGLSHSSIRDAVMFPFLASDIVAARTPKVDDVAYASFYYPHQPAYSTAFGAIRGQVINGYSSGPVLGAHVYTVDAQTGASRVGAFSGDSGSYVIPGLAPGNYLVAIEPLDGNPAGLDPSRINQVVQYTFDTNFPEEFYDADESNVETDAQASSLVAVGAGTDTTGVTLVTNSVQVPGVNVVLRPGYNLFAYPVALPGTLTAFELLQALGDASEVSAIDRYVPKLGSFERAAYVDGVPAGADFPIRRAEGYAVHMHVQKVVNFSGGTDCPDVDLERGLNLIGVACPPAGYTAFQMLADIGASYEIARIERFDPDAGVFRQTAYDVNGLPTGENFTLRNGEGYAITMRADKSGLTLPPAGSAFAPVLTGLTPGRGVPGTLVVVLGQGFDPDPADNLVTFNGVPTSVVYSTGTSLTVTVPFGAATGPVRVAVAGEQSNAIVFRVDAPSVLESPGVELEVVSGQMVEGVLSADGEQDRYTFTALAGSLVTVSAEAVTAGVPDLVLVLEDPFGIMVASDDNGGGGRDPRINNFRLANTGTHTVVVSNVPGGGTGPYHLRLTITTQTTVPQVSILGGNFQTGLGGTTLPLPLSVLVTGPTGASVGGAQVTFVATDPTFGSSSVGPVNAGTIVLDTNASGIVTVQTTLPATDGSYTITVTAPGASPATFLIASTNRAVASVTVNGDLQVGTVGQFLANPLGVVLRDNLGVPVGGALVAFVVASGGGSVNGPACPSPAGAVCVTTPVATGSASTTFRLGTRIDTPHLVAAFVPGVPGPLLFEGVPRADAPATIRSNRSNFNRMTLGTGVLNAMQIQVFDQYDNPVKDVVVNYSAQGGLSVYPGLGPGGIFFTDFETNQDGLHVALLVANFSVMPTFDEFNARVAPVYNVTASVGPSESFAVDVDLGPSMVTSSQQNAAAPMGQPLPAPVVKWILRYERADTYTDTNDDDLDDDNGDFRDEDFSDLIQTGVSGVTINLEVRREDRRDEADFGLEPALLSSSTAVTDGGGYGSVNVTTMGDVGGVKQVLGTVAEIPVQWYFDDETLLDEMTFTDEHDFAEITNLVAIPVLVTVNLQDDESGIDFSTVRARLNGVVFFDPAAPPAVLPVFPEPLQVVVGGLALGGLDAGIIGNSAFRQITINYFPARPRLSGSNTVEVEVVEDRAENPQTAPATSTFAYP